MKKLNNRICICAAAALLFILSGCVSTEGKGENSFSPDVKLENYTLNNGIPVYIKKNTANRLYALDIVVTGGSNMLSPEKSGLESSLFTMMTKGSDRYPYAEIQKIEYETNIGLSSYSLNEGSLLGISCIDYYFDRTLPLLVDAFMHPAYEDQQYQLLLQSARQSIQQRKNDPSSILYETAVKQIFKNHPYETRVNVTEDSLGNITVSDMKALHKTLMDAKRISIIAVGNIDGKALVEKLNKTIGTIPALEESFIPVSVPLQKISGDPVVVSHPSAEGTGYIARVLALPAIDSADFIPCCIASDIYSEILFNIVREKHGACYTPGSSVYATMSPTAFEYISKASDLQNITKYMAESRDLMVQGTLIAGKNKDGSYKFVPIDDKLEGYKNSFLNSQYASVQTNEGVASRMAVSLIRLGNTEQLDKISAKAEQVTAADIERVFKKYWVNNTSRWFAVVGPGDEQKIKF
ncbi:MAG: insulinase family protein [Treponema sp.]|jgi:zinc protease|nr:insulinase family protein [Treponema sp.]